MAASMSLDATGLHEVAVGLASPPSDGSTNGPLVYSKVATLLGPPPPASAIDEVEL